MRNASGTEFKSHEAFTYLGSYVSLHDIDTKEMSCIFAEVRQRFIDFLEFVEIQPIIDKNGVQTLQSVHFVILVVQLLVYI